MQSSKSVFKVLALIFLLCQIVKSGIVKTGDLDVNSQFQQYQQELIQAVDAKTDIKAVKANYDLENYKVEVFEEIINKGGDQQQIQLAKSVGALAVKQKGGKNKKQFNSFLEMERTIPGTDDPYYFFAGKPYTRSIYQLPLSGRSKITPWSGSYWAMKNGGISVRYGRNSYNTIGAVNSSGGYSYYYTWAQSVSKYSEPADYNRLYTSSTFASFIANVMSPAEKYDLIHRDLRFTLTNYTKNEGAKYAYGGNLPGWYGICHGWCPASYIYSKPYKAITVTSAGGFPVYLTPDDVKALASQYMANARYTTRWIGNRCGYYTSSSGWYSDPKCRSLNPGSFLITIGNWVGLQGQNCVMDPQADPEVWNQPFLQYVNRYYNVVTGAFYSTASSARVTAAQVRSCGTSWCRKIASTLSGNAAYVVGVFFRITYVIETNPIQASYTLADQFKTDSYDSAVELDANGNIIGGEWRSTSYPNFMWMPDLSKPIYSDVDSKTPYCDGKPATFAAFTPYAQQASAKGQLIGSSVKYLVNLASQ